MIDLHTHLDLYPDVLNIIDKVNKDNIFTLAVTTSPKAWLATSKVFKNYNNIHVSVGLHPEVVEAKVNEVSLLIECIKNTDFIGEVGIDGSERFEKSLSLQTNIFEQVLHECEVRNGKLISIHSRAAESKVLGLLSKYPRCGIPVLHWFSGGIQELEYAIELGCWFSINPKMCKTKRGLSLISRMPKDRILPESDGPFVVINKNILYPWEAINVATTLSQVWICSIDDVMDQLKKNLDVLLKRRKEDNG